MLYSTHTLSVQPTRINSKLKIFGSAHMNATLFLFIIPGTLAIHCTLLMVGGVGLRVLVPELQGETTVQWKLANRRKQASAPFVTIVEKADKKEYIVIDKKTGKKQCVGADKLYRKQPPLLKDAVKQYIRDSTTRDGYKEAPFLVSNYNHPIINTIPPVFGLNCLNNGFRDHLELVGKLHLPIPPCYADVLACVRAF